MAKQSALFLPANVNNSSVALTTASTTALQTLFTAGSNDSDVKAIIVTNADTAIVNLILWITRSGTDYLLGTTAIPVSAGMTGAVISVDLLANVLMPGFPVDNCGKRFLPLKTGELLKVSCLATMTTGSRNCTVSAFGYDY